MVLTMPVSIGLPIPDAWLFTRFTCNCLWSTALIDMLLSLPKPVLTPYMVFSCSNREERFRYELFMLLSDFLVRDTFTGPLKNGANS